MSADDAQADEEGGADTAASCPKCSAEAITAGTCAPGEYSLRCGPVDLGFAWVFREPAVHYQGRHRVLHGWHT